MKKVLSIVLTIAMVISLMPSVVFAAEKATYTDIKGLKCEAAVEQLTELGIVNGYEESDGTYTFRPENPVNRAEMAKLTIAALGLNPTSGTTQFTDMDRYGWAIPYVGYAESLGIVKGYGNGKFGPGDEVTYDQAITMIVRMLGYTDDSAEMQGTWPANYVQKANELGILKDVNKTGSDPANRGDIAIMLANALDIAMVYVDKDGKTEYKTGKDPAQGMAGSKYVTIRGTLTKNATTRYETIWARDVEDAAKNIRDQLGAAGKVVRDEDGAIISVSDIKTEFMTGDFSADGRTFTSNDKDYGFTSSPLKELDDTGKAISADGIPFFVNGVNGDWDWIENIRDLRGRTGVTLAVTIDGKKINGVYSAQVWTVTRGAQVADADLAQIDKNHKLLGQAFAETNNEEIDNDSYILAGADSLDKIAEDNIVYVYVGNGTIKKIEVGTEVVTGKVTKSGADFCVIDRQEYKVATPPAPGMDAVDPAVIAAGNEVELYLDYSGKIAVASKVSTGNYAVLIERNDGEYSTSALSSAFQMRILTGNGETGVETVDVNTKKVPEATVRALQPGDIFEYSMSDGKVTEITERYSGEFAGKITSRGYLGVEGDQIVNGSLIFAVPTTTGGGFDWTQDDEEYSVLTKDDVLGKTVNAAYYYQKSGEVEVIVIDSGATADSEYGVFTDYYKIDGGFGVDYFIDTTANSDAELYSDMDAPTLNTELFKISKSTTGKVKYAAAVEPTMEEGAATSATKDTVKYGENTIYRLADEVVIYVWDPVKEELTADGSYTDLTGDDVAAAKFYKTVTDADDDNYGCVTYIIIIKATPTPTPEFIEDEERF